MVEIHLEVPVSYAHKAKGFPIHLEDAGDIPQQPLRIESTSPGDDGVASVRALLEPVLLDVEGLSGSKGRQSVSSPELKMHPVSCLFALQGRQQPFRQEIAPDVDPVCLVAVGMNNT
jgi:hypothetical protein